MPRQSIYKRPGSLIESAPQTNDSRTHWKRCPVEAIADDVNGKSKVDRAKCIVCGICVVGCASAAIELEPVSTDEWFHAHSSFMEWEERHLEYLAATK